MIRVVIVDDSPTMRAILAARLSGEPDIRIVGMAADAREGREMIRSLDPDVITLDVEMPRMNGLDFLEKIMTLKPKPVIVVSGATQAGTAATARALSLGAVHCYAKCDRSGNLPLEDHGRLAQLIREASHVRFDTPRSQSGAVARMASLDSDLIAIGASTGGVEALQRLLRDFPEDCPPTLIVQHVNAQFAPAIARSLDSVAKAKVMLAEPGVPLKRGEVYLAPGDDRHLGVAQGETLRISLRRGSPVSGHLPSADVLFRSVASRKDIHATGLILTGMGSDGAQGLLEMMQAGHHTIAQDQSSCAVFGMPRAAIELGATCEVMSLDAIAACFVEKVA